VWTRILTISDRQVTLEMGNILLIIAAYLQLAVTLITLGTAALYTEKYAAKACQRRNRTLLVRAMQLV